MAAKVIAAVFGIITSIIIARAYGAEILGIVAILNSFLMFVTMFTVLGTKTSILRLLPEHLAKYSLASAFNVYRKTQLLVASVALIVGVLCFILAGFIAESIFFKPHFQSYFALGSLLVIFKSLMVFNTQAVRGLRLIQVFAFMELLPSLTNLIILIFVTLFFYHYANPAYTMFASIAITALVGICIMHKYFSIRCAISDVVCHISVKNILSISLPMLMVAMMSFLINKTSLVMLGIFRSESEVGYFSVAVNFALITNYMGNPPEK